MVTMAAVAMPLDQHDTGIYAGCGYGGANAGWAAAADEHVHFLDDRNTGRGDDDKGDVRFAQQLISSIRFFRRGSALRRLANSSSGVLCAPFVNWVATVTYCAVVGNVWRLAVRRSRYEHLR
jgi:hypothetical protein